MKCEYNSDLEFQERLVKVTNEIKKDYPLISTDDAVKIASITLPINDYPTNDDKFDRLYRIMLIIGKDNPEYSHAFNDLYNLYEDGLKNPIYKELMTGIIDYCAGLRDSFPYLDEYI